MSRRAWIAVVALAASCKGGDTIGQAIADEANGCEQAAEIAIDLRSLAGDFSREEAAARKQATADDFKKSCTADSKSADCCAAVRRLKERLAQKKVANCEALMQRCAP